MTMDAFDPDPSSAAARPAPDSVSGTPPAEPGLLRLWAAATAADPAVRRRLFDRVAASERAARAFMTVRQRDSAPEPLGAGLAWRTLYRAQPGGNRRPGEAERVGLLELAPGAVGAVPPVAGAAGREWLVLAGELTLDDVALQALDFHTQPADAATRLQAGPAGARVYLRDAARALARRTDRDRPEAWEPFAPGLRRRVLGCHDGEAALLYRAEPGAAVPGHTHGHDEECLMLEGDVFLDDVLLCTGDWQLAPAGCTHRGVHSDQGGLIYAHGDLHLQLNPHRHG